MFKKSKNRLQKESRIGGLFTGDRVLGDTGISAPAASKLELDIRGTVVPPNDPSYQNDRQLSNNAFQDFPQLIVYCEVFADVRNALAFARENDLWITTRSGGHSTAGFSVNTGIVIDTSRMSYCVVDAHAKRAYVGAGTNFGHLNATLDEFALHTPAGACEDVCAAGHSSGGGYGFTSREFGMNCDVVVEAMVMLYDGRIVIANGEQNSDLFWALRGGTGNNFGVILQLTYELFELRDVWGFGVRWPLANAPAALHELQARYTCGTKNVAPRELGYMGAIVVQKGEPLLLMRGVFDGPTSWGKKALKSLLALEGAELDYDKRGTYYKINEELMETPLPIPDCPDLAREDKRSAIVDRTLSIKEWERVCRAYDRSPTAWNAIGIEAYGGRIEEHPLDFNAFIHRKASMDLFCDVFWMDAQGEIDAKKFLGEFMTVLDPLSNGHQYQNYPRLGTKDYGRIYFGDAYDKLRAIKTKYDPKNVFHYAQSIEPAEPPPRKSGGLKGVKSVKGTRSPDVVTSEPIVVEETRGKDGET